MQHITDVLNNDSWCKKALSLWSIWQQVAGPALTKDTFAYKYDAGVLFIGVRHQYLISEIPFIQDELLRRAKSFYPNLQSFRLVYLPLIESDTVPSYVDSSNLKRRTPDAIELRFASNLSKQIHSSKVRKKFNTAMQSYLTIYDLKL